MNVIPVHNRIIDIIILPVRNSIFCSHYLLQASSVHDIHNDHGHHIRVATNC